MKRWIVVLLIVVVAGAVWLFLRPAPNELPPLDAESGEELGTRAVTLFYSRYDGQGWVSEPRSVPSRAHRDEEIEWVVRELLAGPYEARGINPFPRGTQLLAAFYDPELRLLYLDFDGTLVADLPVGSTSELAVLSCLCRTIALGFPEIESVQILVDGLEVETLSGHVDLTRPLRTQDWL